MDTKTAFLFEAAQASIAIGTAQAELEAARLVVETARNQVAASKQRFDEFVEKAESYGLTKPKFKENVERLKVILVDVGVEVASPESKKEATASQSVQTETKTRAPRKKRGAQDGNDATEASSEAGLSSEISENGSTQTENPEQVVAQEAIPSQPAAEEVIVVKEASNVNSDLLEEYEHSLAEIFDIISQFEPDIMEDLEVISDIHFRNYANDTSGLNPNELSFDKKLVTVEVLAQRGSSASINRYHQVIDWYNTALADMADGKEPLAFRTVVEVSEPSQQNMAVASEEAVDAPAEQPVEDVVETEAVSDEEDVIEAVTEDDLDLFSAEEKPMSLAEATPVTTPVPEPTVEVRQAPVIPPKPSWMTKR